MTLRYGSATVEACTVALEDHPLGYAFQPQRFRPGLIEARSHFGPPVSNWASDPLPAAEFQLDLTGLPALYVPEIDAFSPPAWTPLWPADPGPWLA